MNTLRNKYKSIVEALPDMVFMIDHHGCYHDFIQPAGLHYTISPDDIISKKLSDLLPSSLAAEVMNYISITLQSSEISTHSYDWMINNTARSYEARYVPYQKNKVLAFVRDITERKRLENELTTSREELRQLSQYIESAREKERLNIAREIHEELGQQLTVFKLNISRFGKKLIREEDTANAKEMLDAIDRMIETIRKISTTLRPGLLDDLGLEAAMDWYARDFEKKTGVKTSFVTAVKNETIPQHLTIGIFRIFEESLTNVARHAKASKANISLIAEEKRLLLLIEDNGQDVDSPATRLGILGMKERAIMMKGVYMLSNHPRKGTTIKLFVPLQ